MYDECKRARIHFGGSGSVSRLKITKVDVSGLRPTVERESLVCCTIRHRSRDRIIELLA